MSPRQQAAAVHRHTAGVVATAAAAMLAVAVGTAQAADDPPYTLAREGFFYVGGKPTIINGRTYMAGQMYVDVRIPAKRTQPYPIIMVHGGTRSATTFFRHSRRPRRLGAIFRAPGLRGLRRRSAGAWTFRLSCRVLRPLEGAGWRRRPASLSLAGQVPNCGRKRICTRNGRAAARPTIPSRRR